LNTVSGSVAQQAATIGTKHGLRGYDAVHLAVAVSAQAVGAVSLASYDRELLEAARREGLATVT
jgi:predicted nucleic acid-binding protein